MFAQLSKRPRLIYSTSSCGSFLTSPVISIKDVTVIDSKSRSNNSSLFKKLHINPNRIPLLKSFCKNLASLELDLPLYAYVCACLCVSLSLSLLATALFKNKKIRRQHPRWQSINESCMHPRSDFPSKFLNSHPMTKHTRRQEAETKRLGETAHTNQWKKSTKKKSQGWWW